MADGELLSVETQPHRPIPYALLKIQFQRLVAQHDSQSNGVIFTKDLLVLIDEYEREHDVFLLTDDQKKAIQPYTFKYKVIVILNEEGSLKKDCRNPDLEMTADDILNLLKLVFPPSPVASFSAPTSVRVIDTDALDARPRTSAPLRNKSTPWKRRPSALAASIQNDSDREYSNHDFARYYRRSIELTKRLKSSERSLASMTRDNEGRIVQLQNHVDDMNEEVIKQKREISEYKTKEQKSLEQIIALEAHIASIERSETDQKQVYVSIKRLFDEKCGETQKLQDMLRQKELDLQTTEKFLKNFECEFRQLTEERDRLMGLQRNLEQELETSHQTHMQLAEQRSENERLKEIIDSLKCDLDQARSEHHGNEASDRETSSLIKTLEKELEGHIQNQNLLEREQQSPDQNANERLKSIEDEKDYYKLRAKEAMQDLERELNHIKRALDCESRSLENQLADLRLKIPDRKETTEAQVDSLKIGNNSDIDMTAIQSCLLPPLPPLPISVPNPVLEETAIDMNISQTANDVWAQSRIRQRKLDNGKKSRNVQDLHKSKTRVVPLPPQLNIQALRRTNDKIVTNTVTFALYTLLVYIFGIVTSTFLIENGQPGTWEQALVAAASQQGPKSKWMEVMLYWIEKFIFDGEGLPIS
ncbi:hypothetical protein DFQ28_005376 [Apophysomyces sp. BC1034]|nr:hypothetical protein DFQ28_005376 [Apophysomyces sp. BC1034]